MAERLANKRCLIVGGTGGIGLASARRFWRKARASSSAVCMKTKAPASRRCDRGNHTFDAAMPGTPDDVSRLCRRWIRPGRPRCSLPRRRHQRPPLRRRAACMNAPTKAGPNAARQPDGRLPDQPRRRSPVPRSRAGGRHPEHGERARLRSLAPPISTPAAYAATKGGIMSLTRLAAASYAAQASASTPWPRA